MFGESLTPAYHRISAETAKRLIEDPAMGITVIDVRTAEEYDEAHIPGAVLIPENELSERVVEEFPNRDAPIIVYCMSGSRAWEAAHRLVSLGYTAVYDFGTVYNWIWGKVASTAPSQTRYPPAGGCGTPRRQPPL